MVRYPFIELSLIHQRPIHHHHLLSGAQNHMFNIKSAKCRIGVPSSPPSVLARDKSRFDLRLLVLPIGHLPLQPTPLHLKNQEYRKSTKKGNFGSNLRHWRDSIKYHNLEIMTSSRDGFLHFHAFHPTSSATSSATLSTSMSTTPITTSKIISIYIFVLYHQSPESQH